MKANAIKTEIMEKYDVFAPVPKAADLKATIKGTEYRVKIKKGEITKILADRKPVWTPESKKDPMGVIQELVVPKAQRKRNAKKAERPRIVVDDAWIVHLEEVANESGCLRDGDTVRLRVARSHGKPVCAHVDLYQGDEKVATAGVHYRVGFATRGIDDKWRSRVDEAIKAIYRKVGDGKVIRYNTAVVRMNGGKITDATGTINDVLAALRSIEEA